MEIHEARWWSLEPRVGETLRTALGRTLREAIASGALRQASAFRPHGYSPASWGFRAAS